jgi:S-adenosylmethionine decarboxylase
MSVGFEWLVDALECDENALRDVETLRGVFARIMADLQLKTIGEGNWHKFDGEGGVTGLVMLTESHLACHTYPEHKTATFNLYCCRERPEWDWEENLKEMLGAKKVTIEQMERGSGKTHFTIFKTEIASMELNIAATKAEIAETQARIEEAEWDILDFKSKIQNPQSKIVGGEH